MVTKKVEVAGVPHYIDDLRDEYTFPNPDFAKKPSTLVKLDYSDGDRIFRFDWKYKSVEIVPEPDNVHDPNALKVLYDKRLIGYIPKEKTDLVREYLDSPDLIQYHLQIGGGEYKIIHIDYFEDGSTDANIDHGECGPFADLEFYFREKEESPKKKRLSARKIFLIFCGVLLSLMGLLLTLATPAGLIGIALGVLFFVIGVKS